MTHLELVPVPPVAQLAGVSQHYGKTVALNNITLDIPARCMVGLIGPDGVGKSSLLSLISGARVIAATSPPGRQATEVLHSPAPTLRPAIRF